MNTHTTIRSAAALAAALLLLLQGAPAAAQDTLAQAPAAAGPRLAVISAGAAHTCGLTSDGAAYCWGRNEYGQVGDSTKVDRATPVAVAGGREFREISAGESHTCAISVDNEAFCWGHNESGSIGTGPQQRAYPVRVIGNMRVATISAGAAFTCSVDVRGVGFCWGQNNKDGRLGVGGDGNAYSPQSPFGVRTYRVIVAGTRHTCGITVGNKVLCWGANERGQLGIASRTASAVPFPIRFFDSKSGFSAVAIGADHTCALDLSGAAFCWGDNTAGQLGIGAKKKMSVVPVLVAGGLTFTSLVAAGQTTCGTTQAAAGEVYCWGSNAEGQFAGGPPEGSATPVHAAEAAAPVSISLGAGRACGLARDGTPSCWGRGTSGQSGSGPAER